MLSSAAKRSSASSCREGRCGERGRSGGRHGRSGQAAGGVGGDRQRPGGGRQRPGGGRQSPSQGAACFVAAQRRDMVVRAPCAGADLYRERPECGRGGQQSAAATPEWSAAAAPEWSAAAAPEWECRGCSGVGVPRLLRSGSAAAATEWECRGRVEVVDGEKAEAPRCDRAGAVWAAGPASRSAALQSPPPSTPASL